MTIVPTLVAVRAGTRYEEVTASEQRSLCKEPNQSKIKDYTTA